MNFSIGKTNLFSKDSKILFKPDLGVKPVFQVGEGIAQQQINILNEAVRQSYDSFSVDFKSLVA